MHRLYPAIARSVSVALLLVACEAAKPTAPSANGASGVAAASAATAPSPTSAGSIAAPAVIASAVAAVLDDWHDAAAKADEERYFAHFTADGVFLGTDANERWDVPAFRAYARPHFAKGKAWSFRATRRAVMADAAGQLAWFDEDLATAGLGPARGSGVLCRENDGRWRIAHYNLTITVPNERFDEVKKLLAAPAPDAAAPRDALDAGAEGGKPIPRPGATGPQPALDLDSRQ